MTAVPQRIAIPLIVSFRS